MVIADVSDKGIPAAMLMMVSRTLIHSLAVDHRSPSVVMSRANNVLCQNNEARLSDFQQGGQFDDITMLALKHSLT